MRFKFYGLFMDICERIVIARNYAKFTQDELAKKICISRRSLQDLEKGSDPKSSVLLKIAEECGVNPCWLFSGQSQMIDGNDPFKLTPKKTIDLFLHAVKSTDLTEEIDEELRRFILQKQFKKIKEFTRSEGFWNKLVFNHHENLRFLRILTRSLKESKNSFHSKQKLTIENAKELLKKIINDYELRLYKDILNNAITTKTKESLISFIDTELDDLSCFIILSDFDTALQAMKDNLDAIEKITLD